jgi:hypothetical protein
LFMFSGGMRSSPSRALTPPVIMQGVIISNIKLNSVTLSLGEWKTSNLCCQCLAYLVHSEIGQALDSFCD